MTKKMFHLMRKKYSMSQRAAGIYTVFAGMTAGGAAGALLGCLSLLPAVQVSLAAGGLLAGFIITGVGLLNVRE